MRTIGDPEGRKWTAGLQLAGPLLVGTGTWCALGQLTVAEASTAAARVAAPAPLWVLTVAVGLAALVRPWRRRPLLASPAILATLPWWPLPIPAVALVWTGPLAWLPIAAAVGLAIAAMPVPSLVPWQRWTPGRSAMVAGLLTAGLSIVTAAVLSPQLPRGDEPYYLVITQSLIKDGDLRIENNYRERDYAAYFGGDLSPDYLERGSDGEILLDTRTGAFVARATRVSVVWVSGSPGDRCAPGRLNRISLLVLRLVHHWATGRGVVWLGGHRLVGNLSGAIGHPLS